MLRTRSVATAIFLLLVGTFVASSTSGQEVEEFGPGLELSIPQNHNIFLHGTEETPELRRDWPILTGIPGGSASFSKTAGEPENLIDVQGIQI